jgi:hypothetical protein
MSSSGAGSGMAGMAVAIPIPNIDGRRHTNNVSKILNILAIWPAVKGQFIKLLVWRKAQVRNILQTFFVFVEQVLKTRIFCNRFNQTNLGCWSAYLIRSVIVTDLRYLFFFRISFPFRTICLQINCIINKNKIRLSDIYATDRANSVCQTDVK